MANLTQAQREAGVILHRNPTKSGVRNSESTDKLLEGIPGMLRARVVRPALRKASRQVRKKVRQNLNRVGPRSYMADGRVVYGQPIGRSRKTGTYDKLSSKLKAKRSGNKEMSKAIITRTWTKDRGAVVGTTTGPSHRHAAQGHILEYGANIVLWGNEGKRYRLPPRPFLRAAANQTKGLQQMVIVNTMKKWAKQIRSEVTQYPDIDDS